jgi:hypothetical protein
MPNPKLAPPVVQNLLPVDSESILVLNGAGPFKVNVSINPGDSNDPPFPEFASPATPTTYYANIGWQPDPTTPVNGLTNIMFVYQSSGDFNVNYMVSGASNLLTMINGTNATGSCCMMAPTTQKFHFTVHFTKLSTNEQLQHDPYIQVTPP